MYTTTPTKIDGSRWRHTPGDSDGETISTSDFGDKMSVKSSHAVRRATAASTGAVFQRRTETKLTKLVGAEGITLSRHCQSQQTDKYTNSLLPNHFRPQTYSYCLPSYVDSVVCQLEGCITEIGHWMSFSVAGPTHTLEFIA